MKNPIRLVYKKSHQAGQSLLVALAFAAILGVGLLSIYSTAQLANSKRDLVTAADAAAYSGANILAQGLNFTAYTNRAIVANHAVIGQLMAFRSTMAMSQRYWDTNATFMEAIEPFMYLIPPPVGPALEKIAEVTGTIADIWGNKFLGPVRVVMEVLSHISQGAIALSNTAMWVSQQVHLADSLAGFEPAMIAIAKENAPNSTVDMGLHDTMFGPLWTAGQFAQKFAPKIRKSSRTLGTPAAKKDEYLQFMTESNRHTSSPGFPVGHNSIPNAIGLWIATGCNKQQNPLATGAAGLFAPAGPDLGPIANGVINTLDTFASLLSVIANPYMCMFERLGGSELVQLKNGKMAWVAVDSMAVKMDQLPFLPMHTAIGLTPIVGSIYHSKVKDGRYPFAGGATMSFSDNKPNGIKPEGVGYFRDAVAHNALKSKTKSYMGAYPSDSADCVEVVSPTRMLYAVSPNGRTSTSCVLLSGSGPVYGLEEQEGLWAGSLRNTTDEVINAVGKNGSVAGAIMGAFEGQISTAAMKAKNQMDLPGAQPPRLDSLPFTESLPAGVSSTVDATSGFAGVAKMVNAGRNLLSSSLFSGGNGLASTQLDSAQSSHSSVFTQMKFGDMLSKATADLPLNKKAGKGLDAIIAVIKLMSIKISDGVALPPSGLNTAFEVLSDGLPPFFWDVRVEDTSPNEEDPDNKKKIQVEDGNYRDYEARRYNLGPLVYLPLMQDMGTIKTAQNSSMGHGGRPESIDLPDYSGSRNAIKALGKARVYYRHPVDQWMSFWKGITTSSLMLPYWNARNENLSYVDKWSLLALDGLSDALSGISVEDTPAGS